MSYDEFVGIIPSEEPEWHAVRASLTETLRAFDKEDTGMLPLRELRYSMYGDGRDEGFIPMVIDPLFSP